jgi:pimeloyl-ACP methyl ester carboxylesterase
MRFKSRLASIPWRIAAVICLVSAGTTAASPAAELVLAPCHVTGVSEELRCGVFEVTENPDQAEGRQIPLRLVVAPASGGNPAPDPVFVMAGGPGQGASEMVAASLRALGEVRKRRDLVFVDQRGTGSSNALDCELGDPFVSLADGSLPLTELRTCRDELRNRADLTRYTTFHAMPDLDAVRRALGYEQINLWGVSYGTRAALVYRHLYPQSTRALVLDGLAPFEVKLPAHNALSAQRALDLWFEACEADAACAERFPDLRRRFEDLLARLEAEPLEVEAVHPQTGEPLHLLLDRDRFTGMLRGILYSAEQAAMVPLLVERLEAGDTEPLLALGAQLAVGAARTMSLGLTFSVLCSEDVARIDREELLALSEGTFLGEAAWRDWVEICEEWPRATLPEGFAELSPGNTPALLLSGALDPVVPPEWGEVTRRILPGALHLEVPGSGHNVSHRGCLPDLIAEFLEAGTTEGLDTECVQEVRRPPFTFDLAGPLP